MSDSDRNKAWRQRHQLRKVTVDVPERYIAELRRVAWSLRSEDEVSTLRHKWKRVRDSLQKLDYNVIQAIIEETKQQVNHDRSFIWNITHRDCVIAQGVAATEIIAKDVVEKLIHVYAGEQNIF